MSIINGNFLVNIPSSHILRIVVKMAEVEVPLTLGAVKTQVVTETVTESSSSQVSFF